MDGHIGGTVEKWHWQSQRVWYKPWTWFLPRIRVIDQVKVDHVSMSPYWNN